MYLFDLFKGWYDSEASAFVCAAGESDTEHQ